MQDLNEWFGKAGLDLQIISNPITTRQFSVNNRDIFQMSINTKGKKKKEYFQLFLGHEENDIRVIDADSKNQQVILFVKEPARDYEVKIWNGKEQKYDYEIQTTVDFIRKYLMGMDESHLFIAELPVGLGPINKIKDAHRVLKPETVIIKERDTGRIKRQGEWFFIPTTTEEMNEISRNQEEGIPPIDKKVRIGGGWTGNAHIADQHIINDYGTFVRGKICHVEHKTIKLHDWYIVERNTEGRVQKTDSNFITDRIKWVD